MRASVKEILRKTNSELASNKSTADVKGALRAVPSRFDRRTRNSVNPRATGSNRPRTVLNKSVVIRECKADSVNQPVVIQSRRSSQTEETSDAGHPLTTANSRESAS